MLRYLILMLHLTDVPVYLHYITDWRRSKGNINSAFVEVGCFTALVFSTFGGMSTICNILFKRLASLIADKGVTYVVVMSCL